MRTLTLVVGLFLAFATPAFADEEFIEWPLGETVVTITVVENGPGLTFFAPHENEQTSVAVALTYVKAHGGKVVTLNHTGKRNISFTMAGAQYAFDPNRMFTDAGAEQSLKDQGKNFSPDALVSVRAFADVVFATVMQGLGEKNPIVAVHNNTDGQYSIEYYRPGGQYDQDASYVFQSSEQDPDDFFFVTTVELYVPARAKRYNVALQSAGATDDGSLSVHAAKSGVPYVNVEAQEGHEAEQAAMLTFLADTLK